MRALRAMPRVEQEGTILFTTEYGIFRFDAINRPVNEKKLARLVEAIRRKNLLHLFPIVVSTANVVIDGQHRLRAARELGVPIYYLVSTEMKMEDAADVAGNTTAWRNEDWIHHWRMRGNPNYIALHAFMQRYPWLPASRAVRLVATSSRSDTIAAGTLVADDIEFADQVAQNTLSFKPWFKYWKTSQFVQTMQALTSDPRYSHKQMMSKMEYLSTRLVRCATVEDYLDVINGIYNYRVSPQNHVTFKPGRGVGMLRGKQRERVERNLKEYGRASQYKGVRFNKGRWEAQVNAGNESIYVGRFDEERDAAWAYDEYVIANKLDAPLNFPENHE